LKALGRIGGAVPTWAVTIEVDVERAEDLSAELLEEGAGGVEIRDGEGMPMPGVAQPSPGRAILVGWFALRADADAVGAARGGAVEEVPDQDWGETWKKGLAALTVGRVHVRPTWIAGPAPDGTVEVVLDPGMAFGTGTHPTTSLCLAALSDLLGSSESAHPEPFDSAALRQAQGGYAQDRLRAAAGGAKSRGARVLDVGTGSGLLAISAAKLGAARVAANDNDPVALTVARENAEANGAAVDFTAADVRFIEGAYDIVVANILANTLVELAPALAARLAPGGVVLLSGILAPQEDEVRRAYLALGLVPLPGGDRRDGEWSLLALTRASAEAAG
jgi:ribosomal protein L11 methyltransferase